MTKTMALIGMLLVVGGAPAVAEETASACGDPVGIAALYHEAVYAADRVDAEAKLVAALFPAVACLSREGYLEKPSGLPGRFRLVMEVLAAMRRQSLRISTVEDVQRQVRVGKAASERGER